MPILRYLAAWCVISAASLSAEVRAWEGTLPLPAYEEALPDPNPPFDLFATSRFNYPYTLRENLTGRRIDVEWRAIFLENEFLKCSILPDVGGHLYTCVDKLSGQPMFYANPSLKKARIGYRGAWAAFGIEFNFPVSHNWLSMSPVQFAYAQHPDGSASATVGATDRVYGMEWAVELRLRPGSTVLEQHVTLSNRSDVRHRFYWWSNAGVRVWDDSRIQYPMRFAASHGFTKVETWPVDSSGIDMSLVANQTKGPVSMFVHGSREPFMGVYHPQTNTGVVHLADYSELPAKKIWSWGVDADGREWRNTLSDDNSGYVEVQAGLFRNQETYAFLEPRQTIRFTEMWMPVRGLGGIARANLEGVVNLSRREGKLVAALNVNRAIRGAHLRLLEGTKVVHEEPGDLAPARTWTYEANIPEPATFELQDATGAVLLRQTEGVYDWTPKEEIQVGPQPVRRFAPPTQRTEGEFAALGTDQELNGRLLEAWATYTQGLLNYPKSIPLGLAAGRLASTLLRFEDAIQLLEPLRERATYDPEIAYYLGIAYEGIGDLRHARTAFEAAQRMPERRAAACLKLGELLARSGDLGGAAHYLSESLKASPEDLRAAEELIAVYRAQERKEAETLAREWQRRRPTSLFLTGQVNSDPDRVLNLATLYMRLGMWSAAQDILSATYPAVPPEQLEPGTLPPAHHPLVAYYLAYCQEKLGKPATSEYARASSLAAPFVFPAGTMTREVLRAAIQANPEDALAHFFLGSMLLTSGQVDQAIAEWERARQLNPKIPVLHANLGRTLLYGKRDAGGALIAFRQGLAADPANSEVYTGANQALSTLDRPAAERISVLRLYPDPSKMPAPLVYDLALNLAEARQFDDAEALFRNRFFPREEGGVDAQQVWTEVRTLRALDQAEGAHCEEALATLDSLPMPQPGLSFVAAGLEDTLRAPRFDYLAGKVEKSCGREGKAQERFERVAKAGGMMNLPWADRAARELPAYDAAAWGARLRSALQAAGDPDEIGPSWRMYLAGLARLQLGEQETGSKLLRESFLAPDQRLAHHLSRLELQAGK